MNPDPNQPPPIPSANEPLQFDKAEFEQPPACAVCKTPIAGEYYQANGQPICPACRQQVANSGIGGSGAARFMKSLVAGIAAGIVGFIGYYLVLKLTGYNIGLIAIAVGWLIGLAVRWGSEGRGGLLYQFLAAGITYVAACATYAPLIVEAMRDDGTAIGLVHYIFAFAFSMVAVWLEGPSNIIGWAILAFAVYQAWIMNRKANIEIIGPFFARQSSPPAAS